MSIAQMCAHERLPNRRLVENFGSAAETAASDSGIAESITLQLGADIKVIRKALYRNARSHASGPLGAALFFYPDKSLSCVSTCPGAGAA
jgi:hypothetical protein